MSRTFFHTHPMDTNYLSVGKAERRVSLRRQDATEAAERFSEMLADEATPVDFSSPLDDESAYLWEMYHRPEAPPVEDDYSYCEVCRRVTDHVAEHDELVSLGMARYEDGNVILTDPNRPLPNVGWANAAYSA